LKEKRGFQTGGSRDGVAKRLTWEGGGELFVKDRMGRAKGGSLKRNGNTQKANNLCATEKGCSEASNPEKRNSTKRGTNC